MTTSPFGSPVAPEPERSTSSSAPVASPSRRKPLLIAVGAVAAVAAVGAGAFFLLGGEDPADVAATPVARGQGSTPEPSTTETLPAEPEAEVTLSSRNPFAVQVGAGAADAPTTTPETSSAGSGSTGSASDDPSSSGSSGSGSAAAAGADGKNGKNGKNGINGKNGTNGEDGEDGAAGVPPQFITIQLIDVDEDTNTVAAVLRTSAAELPVTDLAIGAPFDATVKSLGSRVLYKSVGSDLDADGQIDFVTITVDGVPYTTHVGETFLGFIYE